MTTLDFVLAGRRQRVYLDCSGNVYADAEDYAAPKEMGVYLADYPEYRVIDGRPAWPEVIFFHILWDDMSPDEFGFAYLTMVLPAIRAELQTDKEA